MILKCVTWNDTLQNTVEFLVRDCDDNPAVLPHEIDVIEANNRYGKVTRFHKCKFIGRNTDYVDSQMLVHPHIYKYERKEPV